MDKEDNLKKLVTKAIKGNVKAYGQLIEQHKEYLYKIAFLHTKNEHLALDAVGDCILKGFEQIKKLRQPEYFRTWLTRILINACNDLYKKTNAATSIEKTGEIVEQTNSGIEEKWDLYEAIDLLPEKYRTVIILKYFEDFKIQEIAYAMEIPEGSVKSYLSRAKQELRTYLKEGYLYAK